MTDLDDLKTQHTMNQLIRDPAVEMRISAPVLDRVCKNMIEILLHCLPQAIRGTVYKVGPIPELRVVRVTSGHSSMLNKIRPDSPFVPHISLITFVKDRPGHDRRYAIGASKIERELVWQPKETFETRLRKIIRWYLENPEWVASVQTGRYKEWLMRHYGMR